MNTEDFAVNVLGLTTPCFSLFAETESSHDDDTLDPNFVPLEAEGGETSVRDDGMLSSTPLPDGQPIWTSDDSSPSRDSSNSPNEDDTTRPGRPTARKRIRDCSQWKANVRKRRRNCGETYVTRKGKTIRKKTLNDAPCGCQKECNKEVNFGTRHQLFSAFWGLGDWSAQNTYLVGLVKVNEIKKRDRRDRRGRLGFEGPILPKKTKRNFTREYFLKKSSGATTVVCKKFFLDTFGISNGRLNRIMQTANQNVGPKTDRRGCQVPSNKTPDKLIEELHAFIDAFPKYKSHYCRESGKSVSDKMYFAPGMNVAKLYSLYVENSVNHFRQSVSQPIFRNVLKRDFRFSFHPPLKDTCKTCDVFKVKIDEAVVSGDATKVSQLRQQREDHQKKAENVRNQIEMDKEKPQTKVICFDLQKTLPTPVLTTSVVYYKRQLWTYNLGIHDEQNGTAFMCMWHEGNGSRGPNEVGSCLLKYIKENNVPKNLIAYTDTCGGQNRNIKICLFWLYALNDESNNIEMVDQKFFVSGHSYMSCDRDFGIIEQHKACNPYVFIPDDWVKIVGNSSKKFKVVVMLPDDLIHVEHVLKSIVHRKIDMQGVKVEWLKIQWLRLKKDNPFKIFFKYSLDEDIPFRCLDIEKRSKRDSSHTLNSLSEPLPQLYPNGHPLKTAKFNDLQSLFEYIPSVYHAFYNNLLHGAIADGEGDGVIETQGDDAE